VCKLLKDTPFFFVLKACLEFSLSFAEALDRWRDSRGCHMQQNVGTIHPVDMGHHGVKSTRGHLLKTQVLLDSFVKKLHCPAQTIPQYDLTCRGLHIIAGEVLAATIRSFSGF